MDSEHSESSDDQFDEEVRALELMKKDSTKVIKKDVEGLKSALKRMRVDLPWKECLDISVDLDKIENSEDDIKRELAFYEASVKATMEGRKKLKENGVPYLRPQDYLAEMMKSEKKMEKIENRKEKIEQEKKEKLRQVIIKNKKKKRSNKKKYSRR